MIRIGLLSDTHGYLDPSLKTFFAECNEIWHAGDIGNIGLLDELKTWKPVRAVYGNIDGGILRVECPAELLLDIEGLRIWMTHIAGRPGKYARGIDELILKNKPNLLICGHSHILQVKRDEKYGLLYMNPGAAGVHGFHKVRTAMRFAIKGGKPCDLDVVELGDRVPDNSLDTAL
jgi:putative phosphoesterase